MRRPASRAETDLGLGLVGDAEGGARVHSHQRRGCVPSTQPFSFNELKLPSERMSARVGKPTFANRAEMTGLSQRPTLY